MFLLQQFAIVKYNVFVAKICKHALRASIEGYLAVAASMPTYSSLLGTNVGVIGNATPMTKVARAVTQPSLYSGFLDSAQ